MHEKLPASFEGFNVAFTAEDTISPAKKKVFEANKKFEARINKLHVDVSLEKLRPKLKKEAFVVECCANGVAATSN
eukprot:2095941-Karenia_brevis.AAC.1